MKMMRASLLFALLVLGISAVLAAPKQDHDVNDSAVDLTPVSFLTEQSTDVLAGDEDEDSDSDNEDQALWQFQDLLDFVGKSDEYVDFDAKGIIKKCNHKKCWKKCRRGGFKAGACVKYVCVCA